MKPILVVDNEEKFCKVLHAALELEQIPVEYVLSASDALEWLKRTDTDIVISDLRMEGIDGLELLRRIKIKYPQIDVIIMTAFATQKTAVAALKEGAFDYLIKPFEMDELALRIKRLQHQRQLVDENRKLKSRSQPPIYFETIVGRSDKMNEIYRLIRKAAESDSTVLIRGESGTGKELVAEAVHTTSQRKKEPFVTLNCAALPESLLESELFGYEKGAFTGAISRRIGKFESAGKGTIFLDEIGDMSLNTQAKLLRVLQNREIFRLGGNDRISIDTRIIAATHQNLEEMVDNGKFRQDLYYRLNVFPIQIPPLRERKEDIPELVNFFIKQTGVVGIDRNALSRLMDYDWPGNVRELQNVIERSSILAESIISEQHLPPFTIEDKETIYDFTIPENGFQLDEFEEYLIRQALKKSNGNKTQAAKLLGVSRRRLYSLMDHHNIQK